MNNSLRLFLAVGLAAISVASAWAQSARVGVFLVDRTEASALEPYRERAASARDWLTADDFFVIENGGSGRLRIVEFDVLGATPAPLEVTYQHYGEYNSHRSLHPSFRAFARQVTDMRFGPEQDPFRAGEDAPQTNLYENLCTQMRAADRLTERARGGRVRLVVFSDGVHFTPSPAFDMYHDDIGDFAAYLDRLGDAYGCALPDDLGHVEVLWVAHRTLDDEAAVRRALQFWRAGLTARGASFEAW